MADFRAGYEAARFNPLDFPQSLDLPKRAGAGAWHEHTPFIKVLIQLLRPKILVQSGIDNGDSYLAVCEATAAMNVACYGVDTTRRDAQTGDAALNELRAVHDPLFSTFSRLIAGPFEEAAAHFAENSVELLLIDGLQTFEAVCHDWETWRPKVGRSAVVVFHGTDARTGNFGMWRLWKQLKFTYQHFEFLHGQGLGVLVTGPGIPEALNAFLSMAEKNPEPVRKYFFALGSRAALRAQLDTARDASKTLLARLADSEAVSQSRADDLARRDLALAIQTAEVARVAELSAARDAETKALHEKLEALRTEAAEGIKLRATIDAHERALQSRDAELKSLGEQLEKVRAAAADGVQLKATIDALERSVQTRDAELKTAGEQLEKLRVEAAEGVKLRATIDAYERALQARDSESRALGEQLEKTRAEAARISDLNSKIEALERTLRTRDGEKQALAEQLQKALAAAAEVETLNAIIEEQEQTTRVRESNMRTQSEQLESLRTAAAEATALAAKVADQDRQLLALDAEKTAREALQAQLQKLQAESGEIGRLNAKIDEREQAMRARDLELQYLKEQVAKLQFEVADRRSDAERIQSSSSYKFAQVLTAPLRWLKSTPHPAPKEVKSALRK